MICTLYQGGCHDVTCSCTKRTDVVALNDAARTCAPEGAADSGAVSRLHSPIAAWKDDDPGIAAWS